MGLLLGCFLSILRKFKLWVAYPAIICLSILTHFILDTSFFGMINPYWKDWFSRPMWLAGLLIAFHIIYWLYTLKNLLKRKKLFHFEELTFCIMLPSSIMFIGASFFSSFGLILVLHTAIPTTAVLTIFLLSHTQVSLQSYWKTLPILILFLAPFYYHTAWSDWNFTYCDVKPKDAQAEIKSGFGKGIRTNEVYKQLYEWIDAKTNMYSSEDDFIISYIWTPMVYMIAKRRPAISDSFLDPPEEWNQSRYRDLVSEMITNDRHPSIAFVFQNSPALNIGTEGPFSTFKHNLKGDTYNFFGPRYHFKYARDPLSQYIRKHMQLIQTLNYPKNTVRCFVAKSKL